MGKIKFKNLLIAVGLSGMFICPDVSAQVVMDLERIGKKPGFHVDLASFYDPAADKIRLEVYYQIHNNHLTFVKADQTYLAAYEIRVLVLKGGKQVGGTSLEEQYPVSSYAETISPYNFLINQLSLEVEPGKYEAQVTLVDKNARRGYSFNLPFRVPDFNSKEVAISDLELSEEISDTVPGSQFNKIRTRIIPKVNQKLLQSPDSLQFYVEIYVKRPRPLEIEFVTLNQWEKRISRVVEKLKTEDSVTPLIRKIPTRDLPPGKYTLRATLLGGGKSAVADTRQDFIIDWSIEYFVQHDFQEAVDFLSYLATGQEIKALKDTPPEKQAQAWHDFWKSKDPNPETPENEVQDEYYRRMNYANEKFSSWGKSGWKTDFGMIYIKYGEPDEIDRHPYDKGSKAYETWHYYRLRPRRAFTFVDDGYGEYKLIYPYDGDITKIR